MGPEPSKRERPIEILSVEDTPTDQILISEMLKSSSRPYKISFAFDGEEAIRFLQNVTGQENARLPDLILLDMNLPKKNGLEVLREIREQERLNDIPVVILTTSSAQMNRYICRSLRANCFITKPTSLSQFLGVAKAIGYVCDNWSRGQWIEVTPA